MDDETQLIESVLSGHYRTLEERKDYIQSKLDLLKELFTHFSHVLVVAENYCELLFDLSDELKDFDYWMQTVMIIEEIYFLHNNAAILQKLIDTLAILTLSDNLLQSMFAHNRLKELFVSHPFEVSESIENLQL